jgi:hypothetical protein
MPLPTRHVRYAALVCVAILTACGGDAEDVIPEEALPPAQLDVSSRSLTIASDARSAKFRIANTGGEALLVDIESDDFSVNLVSATLPGGSDVVVDVTLASDRDDGVVTLSWTSVGIGVRAVHTNGGVGNEPAGDSGLTPLPRDVVTVDVSVEPLETESHTETVVDTSTKISAGRFTSWSIDAPAGAIVTVELSSTDTVDTWFMPEEHYEAYRRDQQFFIVAGTGFEDTRRANYTTPPLAEGRYELVVSNKDAWLFSRTVTVKADMRWDVTILPSD